MGGGAQMNPNIDTILQQAVAWHRAGQLDDAARGYQQVLAACPDHADAMHLLGVVRHQAGRHGQAVDLIRQALYQRPNNAMYLSNFGLALRGVGQHQQAYNVFKRALKTNPQYPEAHHNIAGLLVDAGHIDEALNHYQQAIRLRPNYVAALQNLGTLLAQLERWPGAEQCGLRLLEINPHDVNVAFNLARMYRKLGRPRDAIEQLEQVLCRAPEHPEVLRELAEAHIDHGDYRHGVEVYEQLAALRPDDATVHNGLAVALRRSGRPADAVEQYRRAIQLDPNFAKAHSNLGVALKAQGRLPEALVHYRRADELQPDVVFLSNLLFSLNYDPHTDRHTLFAEHARWRDRYSRGEFASSAHRNDSNPDRRLRIGYVSGDLYRHPAARFIEPLLIGADRRRVELFIYANMPSGDNVTQRMQQYPATWRHVWGRSDEQFCTIVRDDAIDILVDLSAHSARGRLTAFARKPAPVQVSYLGYPNTSAVDAMDYYIGDAVTDPLSDPKLYFEQLMRFEAHSFACLQPIANAPDVAPLPAQANKRITFGSLLDMAKINEPVLDLWARLIRVTPGAHLYVFRSTLYGATGERLRRLLRDRLDEVQFTIAHEVDSCGGWLGVYGRIDVALDTFPWSGHTTACEAVWMGVPVLTVCGDRHASRMAASVMTALGLEDDFVAADHDQFVVKGMALAERIEYLAALRAGLRQRAIDSPLCDAAGFGRELDGLYRDMWRRWCAGA
jgi:predicted O-linked N-acetylglucosamine transferase (SPINDLY family)